MAWLGTCPLRAGALFNPAFLSLMQEWVPSKIPLASMEFSISGTVLSTFHAVSNLNLIAILRVMYSYYKWGHWSCFLVRRRLATTGELLSTKLRFSWYELDVSAKELEKGAIFIPCDSGFCNVLRTFQLQCSLIVTGVHTPHLGKWHLR